MRTVGFCCNDVVRRCRFLCIKRSIGGSLVEGVDSYVRGSRKSFCASRGVSRPIFERKPMTKRDLTMTISVGEEMNPSRRNTMEDSMVVLKPGTWKCSDPTMTYLAVHDGHGGEFVIIALSVFVLSFSSDAHIPFFIRPRHCQFS